MSQSEFDAPQRISDFDIELKLLLEAIYLQVSARLPALLRCRRCGAGCRRRCDEFGLKTLSHLQDRIMRNGDEFSRLFQYLTVQVSEMFRDPAYFLALREHVLPRLRTYPSIKVWVAGCSTRRGTVVAENPVRRREDLTERTLFYATDINPDALARAESGIYALDRIQGFTQNYLAAGGKRSLSDYYHAAYGGARFRGLAQGARGVRRPQPVHRRSVSRSASGVVPQRADLFRSRLAGSRAGSVRERARAARFSRSGQQGKPAVFHVTTKRSTNSVRANAFIRSASTLAMPRSTVQPAVDSEPMPPRRAATISS